MKYFQSLLFISLSVFSFLACSNNNAQARNENQNITCDSASLMCLLYNQDQQDQTITVDLKNNTPGTRTANIDIWRENMNFNSNVNDINNVIVGGNDKIHIGVLRANDPTQGYSFQFNFESFSGRLNTNHDDDHIYELPFEPKKKYKLIQGYGGKFSHRDEQNYFSYDFRMPIGDSIHAIRDGIVVELEESYSKGGARNELKNKANYVMIEHEDGTYAIYSHLHKNGVIAELGQRIEKGQKIALSGNTGFSKGPHLHLSVLKLVSKSKMQSMPVKFRVGDEVSSKLEIFKEYARE